MLSRNEKRVINHEKLQELVNQVDPRHTLDPEVEDVLLEMADEFLDDVIKFGCEMAKLRKSDTLEIPDLQHHLEKKWGVVIPGFGPSSEKPFQPKPKDIEDHENRVKLVKAKQQRYQRNKRKGMNTQ